MPILTPNIRFSNSLTTKHDTAILLVNGVLSEISKAKDKENGGILTHQITSHPDFKGECGQTLVITLPPKAEYIRILLLGVAKPKKMKAGQFETAGGNLCVALSSVSAKKAAILNGNEVDSETLSALLLGIRLGSYSFDVYKTKNASKQKRLESLTLISPTPKKLEKETEKGELLADSIAFTRDLVNTPPNKLYPKSFADLIKESLAPLGVKIHIFDDKALTKMGMGCLMSVGQASEHLPRLVVMQWNGAGMPVKSKNQKPIGFVGKGITFDSGGLNVKSYEGMMSMKMDMAGAAAVVGLMRLLAKRKCKASVVAAVALAENSISDEAMRPSDIITSYSGKTVEVLNTDAEGRLILCDAISYIQEKYDPELLIDIATLTGAVINALGTSYAGLFTNSDDLGDQLENAGRVTGEKVWRLPVDDDFRKEMNSDFADIKNISANKGSGGSCSAAAFLEDFIDEGRAWAHLDIAGVAMTKSTSTCPVAFASGFGVKLLNKFVEDNHG